MTLNKQLDHIFIILYHLFRDTVATGPGEKGGVRQGQVISSSNNQSQTTIHTPTAAYYRFRVTNEDNPARFEKEPPTGKTRNQTSKLLITNHSMPSFS